MEQVVLRCGEHGYTGYGSQFASMPGCRHCSRVDIMLATRNGDPVAAKEGLKLLTHLANSMVKDLESGQIQTKDSSGRKLTDEQIVDQLVAPFMVRQEQA